MAASRSPSDLILTLRTAPIGEAVERQSRMVGLENVLICCAVTSLIVAVVGAVLGFVFLVFDSSAAWPRRYFNLLGEGMSWAHSNWIALIAIAFLFLARPIRDLLVKADAVLEAVRAAKALYASGQKAGGSWSGGKVKGS